MVVYVAGLWVYVTPGIRAVARIPQRVEHTLAPNGVAKRHESGIMRLARGKSIGGRIKVVNAIGGETSVDAHGKLATSIVPDTIWPQVCEALAVDGRRCGRHWRRRWGWRPRLDRGIEDAELVDVRARLIGEEQCRRSHEYREVVSHVAI